MLPHRLQEELQLADGIRLADIGGQVALLYIHILFQLLLWPSRRFLQRLHLEIEYRIIRNRIIEKNKTKSKVF